MNEEYRPDPEALLHLIKKQEEKSKGGKLKIFFGMSAGVGKTYSMLEDGQQQRKEGADIVIATVNTHGRKETAALVEGFPIIPEKSISYKGSTFTELDLDAIIKRQPEIVIVDELAHTNVPGSRHPKRWQDVIEILDAGIDVYTTINVQHLESRKDLVEEITGISIRETVPDSILERASQMELVDITPTELLKRLKEGKVYLGAQSEIAAKNFFQADRLTALREIALRLTAEKVDYDLHGMIPGPEKVWKSTERLMVAFSHSPHSLRLVRTARRYAFTLNAPWVAVHVDTGSKLSTKDSEQLAKNIALARELGAEVITVADTDVGNALQRIARQKNVTQIILGRSKKRFFKKLFGTNTLFDFLNRNVGDIDIHVIRQDTTLPPIKTKLFNIEFTSTLSDYTLTAIVIALISIICGFSHSFLTYQAVGFLFLLAIICFSFFINSGPLIFSAVAFSLIWGFFFIPPSVSGLGDFEVSLMLSYFVVAIALSIFTERLRNRELLLRRREEKSLVLYEIVRDLATASFSKELFQSICNQLNNLLHGKSEIILKQIDNGLIFDQETELLKDEKEQAVAIWAFDQGKIAGRSTDTLSSVKNLYIPLKGFREVMGILAFEPIPPRSLQQEELNLLQTICQQISNYVERTFNEEKVRKAEYLNQIEKIQHAILNSISLEFRTPLYSIKGAAKELKNPELTKNVLLHSRKIQQIEESSNNLNRIVDNVLALSKLSSGFLQINKELNSIPELIDACLLNLEKNLENHIVKVQIPDNIPKISFDFAMMELLVCNLLLNAAEYSPPGKQIFISSRVLGNSIVLTIGDEGPGIPVHLLDQVFEKFYRIPGTEKTGMGLGLAVVKTIADMHNAKIEVHNRPIEGVEFTLFLPR